jgi:two-component system, LytTR family, response regulator LytT
MKVLILEDEIEATKNIIWLLKKIVPQVQILDSIESVAEGIDWLNTYSMPDLILSDIHLADGLSFHIFEQTKVTCPVIFTTAFDAYALQAFQVYSIDYLLKPLAEADLRKAIEKYNTLNNSILQQFTERFSDLIQQVTKPAPVYRKSFLVRFRDKILPIKTESFAYFFTKEDVVYGCISEGVQYVVENTLEELEEKLNPSLFFRANRQYIVSREAILEIEYYFNGRLSLLTKPLVLEKILISKERVPIFKLWFEVV